MTPPPDPATLETPESVTLSIDLAGVGSRGLACLIDTAIIIVGFLMVSVVFGVLVPVLGSTAVLLAIIGTFSLQWLYFTAFESVWNGQTPGKRAVGLRVQKLGGYPVGWTDAMIRNFLRMIDFLMVYGVGIIVMLLNERSQRIGDFAAGTVVVRERSGGAAQLGRMGYQLSAARGARPGGPDLTAGEFETLNDFLERRGTLQPEAFFKIQELLAEGLRRRLASRGALREEWKTLANSEFLEALAAEFRGEVE